MKIAILSDIHDNIWKLSAATKAVLAAGAEHLIFCGDFCAPFTLKQLADETKLPIDAVWGNNDGDKWLLTKLAAAAGNVTLHGELAELTLDGLRIGVNHYPEIALRLAQSGAYAAVFYGHNHIARTEQIGDCLLLNPGEIMGRFGKSTFALFDTEARGAVLVEVDS